MVDCGMVDFLDQDRRSNLVLPLRFGQGNKPPNLFICSAVQNLLYIFDVLQPNDF